MYSLLREYFFAFFSKEELILSMTLYFRENRLK